MLSFGVEKINRTFFLSSKPLNVLGGTFFVVCSLVNTLFLLFFAVYFVIESPAATLLHFNLEIYHSYFAFSFLTTVDLFYCLFRGFRTLNTYTLSCLFIDRVQKWNCYLSVSTLLYLVCCLLVSEYVLSTVFWHFNLEIHQSWLYPSSFHSKYTKHTLFFSLMTAKNVTFTSHAVFWPSKH